MSYTAPLLLAASLSLSCPFGLSAAEAHPTPPCASANADVEQLKETVRSYYQRVWNDGDLSAIDELFGSDYDRESLKNTVSTFRWGFSDLTFKVVNLIGEGNLVAAYWTAEARHSGKIFGVEATGAWVSVTGIEIFRIEDGKIQRDWQVWDRFDLMKQLRDASARTPPLEAPKNENRPR